MRKFDAIKSRENVWKYGIAAAIFIVLAIVAFLEVLAHGAAYIFNEQMQEQTLLRGTIRVEKILAHINGRVNFENLEWLDPRGNVIMSVPSGSLKVRVWDIATNHITSTTLEELTLNQAIFAVHLNKNREIDFLRRSKNMDEIAGRGSFEEGWEQKVRTKGRSREERARIGAEEREERRARMERELRNYQGHKKHLKLKLNFNDCRMEAFSRGHHYILSHVNIAMHMDTNRIVAIDMDTGAFGGTMVGSGMSLHGRVDFSEKPVPSCDLSLRLKDVLPASLGIGMNINERMTLSTHMEGKIIAPSSNGTVQMQEFHIPGLDFYNIEGFIHLDESKLIFDQVTADIFGGRFVAEGAYDFDTRSYTIRGRGTELEASKGIKKSGLSCRVNLDLAVEGDENPRKTIVTGEFVSGKGNYRRIPFHRLSGTFRSGYKDLAFWDVAIEFYGLTVTTPGFRVQDGELMMEPLTLYTPEGEYIDTVDTERR